MFLLSNGVEVDIGFTSHADFASRGARFRPVFGEYESLDPHPPPPANDEIGLGWHHVLHARACIERGKPWQAAWLIQGVRDHTVTLACIRQSLAPYYACGADDLPAELKGALEPTLVRALDDDELRRALHAVTEAYLAEVREHDAELAAKLDEPLRSVT